MTMPVIQNPHEMARDLAAIEVLGDDRVPYRGHVIYVGYVPRVDTHVAVVVPAARREEPVTEIERRGRADALFHARRYVDSLL